MDGSDSPLSVTALMTRLGQLFMADRLEEATRFWTFPCPVEVAGELTVMPDARALEGFFRRRRELAREMGLLDMTPHVIAVEVPRDGRFRAWLRWRYAFADRTEEDSHASVYFMVRKRSGALVIEMMDIVRVPAELSPA
jgi:hypothetical protein